MANEYLEGLYWYVVHTYSGYENKVKINIEKSIQNLHLEDQIQDVLVPTEEVQEVKNGRKRTIQRKLFPGYVILHMVMNDETWYVVRNTRGVTGFVGPESKPVPLSEDELAPFGIDTDGNPKEEGNQKTIFTIDVEPGDAVTIANGVWEGRDGVVRSVDNEKGVLSVCIDMFGREQEVEVDFTDVRKV